MNSGKREFVRPQKIPRCLVGHGPNSTDCAANFKLAPIAHLGTSIRALKLPEHTASHRTLLGKASSNPTLFVLWSSEYGWPIGQVCFATHHCEEQIYSSGSNSGGPGNGSNQSCSQIFVACVAC